MLAEMVAALSLALPGQSRELGLDGETLCMYVAENLTDTSSFTPFHYRSYLFRAAGVDPAIDDAATIRAKMQAWWNRHRTELICNVPNSVVRDGNIMKLAVDSSSSEFINDVVRRWRLDLNQVDADGKTVLDFIDEQRSKTFGTSRFAIMDRYYGIFESNGAVRTDDLPAKE